MLGVFSWLTFPFAAVLLFVLSILSLYVAVFLSFRGTRVSLVWRFAWGGLLLSSAPVWDTLNLGQVNLILMSLIAADILWTNKKIRGSLIGIAAAIKITPAFFLLIPLIRRDWKMLIRASLVGLFATALGIIVVGVGDSLHFFTEALWDVGRVGSPSYVGNQSLRGMLYRAGIEAPWWWLFLSVLILISTILLIRMWWNLCRVFTLLVVAVSGLLIAPIAWHHHWVWVCIIPGTVWALGLKGYRSFAWITGLLGVVLAVWRPMAVSIAEEDWGFWGTVLSSVYVWCGFLWLAVISIMSFWKRRGLGLGSLAEGIDTRQK